MLPYRLTALCLPLLLSLSAQASFDPAVQRTLQATVRLRNGALVRA